MPLLLLAWVICAPAFLKCFKVFPLCEFSGNTHYLPGCHNTVFADWVTSALVIQNPLFSEQIATENDNGSLQTGENKTMFPYGLATRACKRSRDICGAQIQIHSGVLGRTEVWGNAERIECIRTALPPAVCPTFEHIRPRNLLGSASVGNERLGLEIEIPPLA